MFCSATPIWKKRSGCRSLKKLVMVDSERSPTRTQTFGFSSPNSTRARPNPSRVFFMGTGSARARFMTISAPRASRRRQARFPRLVGGAEIRQRPVAFFLLGRLAVPAVIVLHERNAAAHDGLGQYHGGLALHGARLVVGRDEGGNVVAVDRDRVPSEGAILVG